MAHFHPTRSEGLAKAAAEQRQNLKLYLHSVIVKV